MPDSANFSTSSTFGAFDYQTVGHTVFALGRFVCAFAGWFIKPRLILLTLYIGLIITSILAMNTEGNTAIAMVILILFFEVSLPSLSSYSSPAKLQSHPPPLAILVP